MSNDGEEISQSSSTSRPQSIGQLARIEIEPPARKMRLMFGERQVVFIRSDGLRSRIVRENMKKNKNKSDEQNKKEENDSKTLDRVIDDVAKGNYEGSSSLDEKESGLSTSSVHSSSDVISAPSLPDSSSSTSGKIRDNAEETSETAEKINRKRPNDPGNRSYHPPKQFYGEGTMVPHKKRWTYQTACDINAAERSDESQMYYVANPFYPMPRGRRNEICTATRMNYASQRIDNRKFRGQEEAGKQIAENADERVTCEKCGMSYFYESKMMQERISYLPPVKEEDLPTVMFDCPVCKVQTKVIS